MPVLGAAVFPHPPIMLERVGRGEERKVQSTVDGCRKAARAVARMKPQTVVLCSPHAVMYADCFCVAGGKEYEDDMGRFGAPSLRMRVEYDGQFVEALSRAAEREDFSAVLLGCREGPDHASFIPLRYINEAYADYRLVRVSLSGLPLDAHFRLGGIIARAAAELGRGIVFVASGDLSHKLKADGPYGFAKEGPVFDRRVTDAFRAADFESLLRMDPKIYEPAAECGLRSFVMMAGALDGLSVTQEVYSYEDTFGVGYAAASFAVG